MWRAGLRKTAKVELRGNSNSWIGPGRWRKIALMVNSKSFQNQIKNDRSFFKSCVSSSNALCLLREIDNLYAKSNSDWFIANPFLEPKPTFLNGFVPQILFKRHGHTKKKWWAVCRQRWEPRIKIKVWKPNLGKTIRPSLQKPCEINPQSSKFSNQVNPSSKGKIEKPKLQNIIQEIKIKKTTCAPSPKQSFLEKSSLKLGF